MQLRTPASLIALAIAASLSLTACSDNGDATQSSQQQAPQEVGIVTIERQNVAVSNALPGRVTAFRVAEVRPQVSGILQTQQFEGGTNVTAGQSLYQIDPALFRAQLQSAEAALARAQAEVTNSKARFERVRELIEDKSISQQDFDEAQAAFLQAQANLKVAEANVTRAQLDLDYTEVKAPINGRIGRSLITPGALVQTGQAQPLTYIHQLDPIYVDIAQSSDEYMALQQQIRSGAIAVDENNRAEVSVTLAGMTDQPITGELLFNEATVDPQTSSITLRARFENPDHLLLPGMFVTANVSSGELRDAILAPQQGVTRDPRGRATVMIVNAEGKAETRYIEVSRTIGSNWLVTDGLVAGDQVIVDGLQKIQPGAQVSTVKVDL
ncbi:efflux transporter periplasmic adaptor subunit [Pseudidiomarina aestuarii]|uniref:Efflux transporter periplasmic adaptor subunit n=1 Tax=Pseudidiomarina aestuarii TaxID=624146 RepID=A0A7Z7ETF7_9GAMM|nr:efflux RND transporter periplasmic adaptor subunit [Pseudidiomarina aestuarii]RUO41017.1 efflux transporter periplasmic adaptor subunit [Pseudidiomarina aestuarii]